MTVTAQLADGRTLEFPDGTAPGVVQATVKRILAQGGASTATPEAKPEPSFAGMLTNPEQEAKIRGVAPPSVIGSLLAGPEASLNMGTGMIAKPASDIAGLAASGYEALTGNQNPTGPAGFKNQVQNALTYQPRHIEGQAAAQYNPLSLFGQGVGAVSHGTGNLIRGDNAAGNSFRGLAGNFVEEAIPQAIGLTGGKLGPPAVKATTNAMRGEAESLMQSALKPTIKQLKSGDAAVAIDTMLDKNIPLSKNGVAKLRAQIDVLNDQIADAVKNSTGTVRVSGILPYIQEKLDLFKKQVNPDADVLAVKQAWREFKDHPLLQDKGGQIPVPLAQELKQGTYKQLAKKYGEMSNAADETQKAIARGLKEGIAENAPEVVEFNKQESRLLRTLSVLERRVLMDANKNPMGLSLLAKDPAAWTAFMLDRSASFKSLLAIILNGSRGIVESTGNALVPPTVAGAYIRPPQPPEQQK